MTTQSIHIDIENAIRSYSVATKPSAARSCFGKLFDRHGVVRVSAAEIIAGGGGSREWKKDGDLEPSSVCLSKMVRNFLEESNEKPSRCGRSRCSCFNGNADDDSGDDFDHSGEARLSYSDILKNLVPCSGRVERCLLAHALKLVEKNKAKGGKGYRCLNEIVANGLLSLGYDASICNSRREKTSSFPAGEHKYVDVKVVGGERVLIDVDFRSEFEVARPTKSYRLLLQSLPSIFVGKAERLQQIVVVVCEAMKQSLKEGGLLVAPWRKPEYMRAKWLSPYDRNPSHKLGFKGKEGEADRVLNQRLKKSGEHAIKTQEWWLPVVEPKPPLTVLPTGGFLFRV